MNGTANNSLQQTARAERLVHIERLGCALPAAELGRYAPT
jgi:hypothetical protein